jgi:Tol biopolymer transport system component
VFDLDGHEVVAFVGYDDAAWTPEGKLVATGSLTNPGLFEMDPATKQVHPIDAQVAAPACPAVAPDGATIAFVTGGKIWLIERDGKSLRQLLQDGHVQQRPVFSPDGTKIAAVICNTVANDMTGEVFVIDVKTREVTPLRTSMGSTLVPDTTSRLAWIR